MNKRIVSPEEAILLHQMGVPVLWRDPEWMNDLWHELVLPAPRLSQLHNKQNRNNMLYAVLDNGHKESLL